MQRLWICTLLCGLCWLPVSARAASTAEPTSHTVYAGQTLGKIAKRYNVSIEALCAANGIQRNARIRPGQKLMLPGHEDLQALAAAKAANGKAPVGPGSTAARSVKLGWKAYAKAPKRKGYISLQATGRRWQGLAVAKRGKVAPSAPEGFRHTLYSWRTGKESDIDPRLIATLIQVSDTFGGRTLRIASGYREHSFAKESKHLQGEACDFAIEGVPNEALRDYLLTLKSVGVGYYPNSSFVHLDVRGQKVTWVDTSAPGDAPRYTLKMRLDGDQRAVHRDYRSPRDLNNQFANRR
jgi:uncharacterized protein YcbK (DUF882 family)